MIEEITKITEKTSRIAKYANVAKQLSRTLPSVIEIPIVGYLGVWGYSWGI